MAGDSRAHQHMVEMAKAHIQHHVSAGGGAKAMVLDIDDTALHTSMSMNVLHRNPHVYALYQHAVRRGVAVVFVTARRFSHCAYMWAVYQLSVTGYTTFDTLVMMPTSDRAHDREAVARFKRRARCRVNGEILVNIGDQWSDLTGHPLTSAHHDRPGVPMTLMQGSTLHVKLPSC